MNAATFRSSGKELKFFQVKTGSLVFDVQMKFPAFTIPSFKSYEGPLNRKLVRTSESGLQGQSLFFKKMDVPPNRFLSEPQQFFRECQYLLDCATGHMEPSSNVVDSRILET